MYSRGVGRPLNCSGTPGKRKRRGEKTTGGSIPTEVKPLNDLMVKSGQESANLREKQFKDLKAFMVKQKADMDKFISDESAKLKTAQEADKKQVEAEKDKAKVEKLQKDLGERQILNTSRFSQKISDLVANGKKDLKNFIDNQAREQMKIFGKNKTEIDKVKKETAAKVEQKKKALKKLKKMF